MRERPGPSISAESTTRTVWVAAKGIPVAADLRRDPLRTMAERAHLKRHCPIRLCKEDAGPVLDVCVDDVAATDE